VTILGGPFFLFRVRTIPVFVEPWYLLLIVYWASASKTVAEGMVWAACVTFSILVHELGHGLVALHYKLRPAIVLHGWGGVTAHAPAQRDRDDALIVAAGPSAGLLLGGFVLLASWLAERALPGAIAARPHLDQAIDSLLFVNLFWSCVNLLPMFPLDGGLLFRLGAFRLFRPEGAKQVVHGVGLALAVGWAAVGSMVFNSIFLVIMGLMFAWENYAVLAGRTRVARTQSEPKAPAKTVLDEVRAVWAAGDARETVRQLHMLRSSGTVPSNLLAEVYTLLVEANTAAGEHAEALTWAPYAPTTDRVVTARIGALLALGRDDDARSVLNEHGALLDDETRARFEARLAS
jgi:Zn-dependent protease